MLAQQFIAIHLIQRNPFAWNQSHLSDMGMQFSQPLVDKFNKLLLIILHSFYFIGYL